MDNGTLTIFEASKVTGKSVTTIHRYVKKGLLHVKTGYSSGKEVLTVERIELEKVFTAPVKPCYNTSKQEVKPCYNPDVKPCHNPVIADGITKETLKETFKELVEEQRLQLMKPMEEQSLYIAGRLQSENEFLKQRLGLVVEENRALQEQIKVLPGPVEQVTEKLHEQEKQIRKMEDEIRREQEEKIKLETRLLQEKEDGSRKMQKEKIDLELRFKTEVEKEKRNKEEQIRRLAEEKKANLKSLEALQEERLKELETRWKIEAEELQARLKAEEEEKLKLVEVWKVELEKEQNKPWWKKIF